MSKKEAPQFNVIFRPEPEGGFTVVVPSLPGCVSYGADLAEAKKMAVEAIESYLFSMKKHKEIAVSDDNSFITLLRLPGGARAYA